ncbi:MAG: DNA polymerase IV [Candidatus Latescibacterota bacterium]
MQSLQPREIIYINSDDFHASVVRIRDATLKSRPVVVGHLSSRGSVLAASYEARGDGVRVGITIPQARRLCPGAAFVQIDWALFRRASGALFSRLKRYSPLIEPVGLDEGFIDYTGCTGLFGKVQDTAWRVQKELALDVRLNVSVGLGPNKLTSQVASKVAKCGRIIIVPSGEERAFLDPFPISWLPGVGAAHVELLASLGIKTIGTLSQVPGVLAGHVLGSFGKTLVDRAGGMDERPVRPGRKEERIEVGVTFHSDLVDFARIDAAVFALAETLGRRLRRAGLGTRQVRLRLSYTDGCEVAHWAYCGEVTHCDRLLYDTAHALLERAYVRRVKVRALHLAAIHPAPLLHQGDLFRCGKEKLARLYDACDVIRGRYPGEKSLRFGKTFACSEPAGGSPETVIDNNFTKIS